MLVAAQQGAAKNIPDSRENAEETQWEKMQYITSQRVKMWAFFLQKKKILHIDDWMNFL